MCRVHDTGSFAIAQTLAGVTKLPDGEAWCGRRGGRARQECRRRRQTEWAKALSLSCAPARAPPCGRETNSLWVRRCELQFRMASERPFGASLPLAFVRFESVRPRLQIVRMCTKSGRRPSSSSWFASQRTWAALARNQRRTELHEAALLPHYWSGGVLAPLSRWHPDGASRRSPHAALNPVHCPPIGNTAHPHDADGNDGLLARYPDRPNWGQHTAQRCVGCRCVLILAAWQLPKRTVECRTGFWLGGENWRSARRLVNEALRSGLQQRRHATERSGLKRAAR